MFLSLILELLRKYTKLPNDILRNIFTPLHIKNAVFFVFKFKIYIKLLVIKTI